MIATDPKAELTIAQRLAESEALLAQIRANTAETTIALEDELARNGDVRSHRKALESQAEMVAELEATIRGLKRLRVLEEYDEKVARVTECEAQWTAASAEADSALQAYDVANAAADAAFEKAKIAKNAADFALQGLLSARRALVEADATRTIAEASKSLGEIANDRANEFHRALGASHLKGFKTRG